MRKIVPIFAIFSTYLFFAFSALFGYEYAGSDESSVYIIYSITIFILSMLLFLEKMIFNKEKYNKGQIVLFASPLIVLFFFSLSEILSNNNNTTQKYFFYFILWSVPAIYMGIYISKNNLFSTMCKFIEIVMLIFTGAVMLSTIEALLSGNGFSSIGGETYQTASYLSAFAFGINLYYLYFGENHIRFKFAFSKRYRFISLVLLIFQFMGVFISGGRGGFILMAIYALCIMACVLNQRSIKNTRNLIISCMIFIILFVIIFPKLLTIPSFESSFNRVFSYLTPEGFSWSGTNRDYVYEEAIKYIINKPILGYGIFNWGMKNYPHNFILEVLLNGGIVYLTFWMIVMSYIFAKLFKMIRINPQYRIMLIMLLFPLVMLMFTGTYSINTIFLFSIAFIFSFQLNNSTL